MLNYFRKSKKNRIENLKYEEIQIQTNISEKYKIPKISPSITRRTKKKKQNKK